LLEFQLSELCDAAVFVGHLADNNHFNYLVERGGILSATGCAENNQALPGGRRWR